VWAYGREQTDRQTDRHTHRHTDARDHNTFCVIYDSTQNGNIQREITLELAVVVDG